MSWQTFFLVVLLGSFHASVDAFSPSVSNRSAQPTNSLLFLLPSQGAQLAAAGSCAYDQDQQKHSRSNKKTADQDYENTVPLTNGGEITTELSPASSHHSQSLARSFVSRVFSLPATLLHPREIGEDDNDEDCILYPVVGFQLVQDDDTHFCRALPTTSNPSCRLLPTNQMLVGYYSPACHLKCDGDDDTKYSQKPAMY